ncbi:ubiquinol-cytochrome C reductase [Colletotrichum orchidophilum]|uniref:Complex III subunit 9 n=1 Tax=Colletotrichum orchidophilum TaxID=1209926 RepID=A0A1G4AP30_9PEZI|nr:ubiquinol-cytochrome C reductase [Colletotrichum orchidophilum]OHE90813.1 ubiquinol-cytochrome C reductase [Colletotrichum orchidophilum]
MQSFDFQHYPTQPTSNDHRLADRNEAPFPPHETCELTDDIHNGRRTTLLHASLPSFRSADRYRWCWPKTARFETDGGRLDCGDEHYMLTGLGGNSAIFKNNFSMLGFVFATGFAFEMGFNGAMNKYWDYLNRGRQWKDIRHKYVEAADDDEE